MGPGSEIKKSLNYYYKIAKSNPDKKYSENTNPKTTIKYIIVTIVSLLRLCLTNGLSSKSQISLFPITL